MGAVINVTLAESPDDEMFAYEQKQAIADLLRHNEFTLRAHPISAYHVHLAQTPDALILTIKDPKHRLLEEIRLGAANLSHVVRRYQRACNSYYNAVQGAHPAQIEDFDKARRRLHGVGADALRRKLEDAIDMDVETARRFFTLVASLRLGKLERAAR